MEIHHIGYLVKDIDQAIANFIDLGYDITTPITYDSIRLIHICFMKNGHYCVELICPEGEASSSYSLLKRYKNCPYHICYQHSDLDQLMLEWETSGNVLIQPPESAVAINGKRVCFFMTPIGIVEILEDA